MNIVDQIRRDIASPACLGFVFESDGNSVSVDKNGDKLQATYKSWNGNSTIVKDEEMCNIEAHIAMLHDLDPHGFYCPNFKPTKWSAHKAEQFMKDIQYHLCNYNFEGFELKAEGVAPFIVRKNYGGFNPWVIDGKGGDLVDVLAQTRAKMNENVYWEYAPL